MTRAEQLRRSHLTETPLLALSALPCLLFSTEIQLIQAQREIEDALIGAIFNLRANELTRFRHLLSRQGIDLVFRYLDDRTPTLQFVDSQTKAPTEYHLNDSLTLSVVHLPKPSLPLPTSLDDAQQSTVQTSPPALDLTSEELRKIERHIKNITRDANCTDSLVDHEQRSALEARLQATLNPALNRMGLELTMVNKLNPPSSELTRLGKIFPLVDCLITEKDKPGAVIVCPDKPILSWDEDKTQLEPVTEVGAFLLVSEEVTGTDLRILLRNAARDLNRLHPGYYQVVAITHSLLDKWEQLGGPFVAEQNFETDQRSSSEQKNASGIDPAGEINPAGKTNQAGSKEVQSSGQERAEPSSRPELELLLPSEIEQVLLVEYLPPDGRVGVGGNHNSLVIAYRYPNGQLHHEVLYTDMGLNYDLAGPLEEPKNRPSFHEGGFEYFQRQLAPKTRGLYRLDVLVNSIPETVFKTISKLSTKSPDSAIYHCPEEFILLELFDRLGEKGVIDLLQINFPDKFAQFNKRGKMSVFLSYLRQKHQLLYHQLPQTTILGMRLTHSHSDHSFMMGMVRPEIPLYCSSDTLAQIRSRSTGSNPWPLGHVADLTLAGQETEHQLAVGIRGYPVVSRPIEILVPGQETRLTQDLTFRSIAVSHIPGTIAFSTSISPQNGLKPLDLRMLYASDFRQFRASPLKETMLRIYPWDNITLEATNVYPNEEPQRDSAKYTEADVKLNFEDLLIEPRAKKSLIIVDIVKQNFERLKNLAEVALKAGKTVVVSPNLMKLIELSLFNAVNRDEMPLPIELIRQLKVWKKGNYQNSLEERRMFASHEPVSTQNMRNDPEHYVLFRGTFEGLRQISTLPEERIIWILSTYKPMSDLAKIKRRNIYQLAKKKNWPVQSRGYHASGHWTEESDGVLHTLNRLAKDRRVKSVTMIHTNAREMLIKKGGEFVSEPLRRILVTPDENTLGTQQGPYLINQLYP
ncbi:MAG: hypothetical protein GF381_00545 [Candidatus Pacebacteria bacterium]|nr:hypothetical protein [Candidatus Paceibacterota bacterium]